MADLPRASIVISSYNYARYLPAGIDSALAQTHPATEVIVVDDGSTDDSRAVIERYGDRVTAVFKENGGQASALNEGLKRSGGGAICFMDSDDVLLPTALARALPLLRDPDVVKVHWPLAIIDEDGRRTGDVMHADDLSEGDLRDAVLRGGPAGYTWPSTSGNLWSRRFLEAIAPIPEAAYRIGPDVYLAALAPLFGRVAKVAEVQGCYRIHGDNHTVREHFDERLQTALRFWDDSFERLAAECRRMDLPADPDRWRAESWWHRIERAVQEVASVTPAGAALVLADDDQWATNRIAGRRCVSFCEREGRYWGPPADDDEALRNLERHREGGAQFMVFAWPAFWWFDHYERFTESLRRRFACRLETERIVVFDLRRERSDAEESP